MPTHTLQQQVNTIYFCTITCNRWLALFEYANAYEAVYKWFNYLSAHDKCEVVGYVIMPNHIHILIHYFNCNKSLNKIIGEGKRFMAYDIVKRLKKLNKVALLKQLTKDVTERDRKNGKIHHVFRLSFDAKECFSKVIVEQKLDYIHRNPVSGKWMLIDDYTAYKHSSAAFYELGIKNNIELVHYRDIV